MPSHYSPANFKNHLVAHRGWQRQYPENSYHGIETALQMGIQHIEIDVHLSADHIPVLCHDAELHRLCGVNKDVKHCTLEMLKTLSFHEPERLGTKHQPTTITTLAECAELIAQYPHATLYVELKANSLLHFGRESALNTVHQTLSAILNQVALISFDIDVLLLAKQEKLFSQLIPVLNNESQWHDGSLTVLDPALVFCNITRLPKQLPITELPYPVALYEIDDYELASSLLEQGVKLIESFATGELLAVHQVAQHHSVNR